MRGMIEGRSFWRGTVQQPLDVGRRGKTGLSILRRKARNFRLQTANYRYSTQHLTLYSTCTGIQPVHKQLVNEVAWRKLNLNFFSVL